jgi:hypothetical protein
MNSKYNAMRLLAISAIGLNVVLVSLLAKDVCAYEKCLKSIVERNEIINF